MRLMKRYVTDSDTSDLTNALFDKHILLWTVYSTSNSGPAGMQTPESIWVDGFNVLSDDVTYSTVATSASAVAYYNNILYTDMEHFISGKGSIDLPSVLTPSSDNKKVHAYFVISFQITADFDQLLSLNFHIKNGNMSFTQWNNVTGIGYHQSAFFGVVDLDPATEYDISVDYEYAEDEGGLLDIRMYTDSPVPSWFHH